LNIDLIDLCWDYEKKYGYKKHVIPKKRNKDTRLKFVSFSPKEVFDYDDFENYFKSTYYYLDQVLSKRYDDIIPITDGNGDWHPKLEL
jgi:hypothetical protein